MSEIQGLTPQSLTTEIEAATKRAAEAPVVDFQKEFVSNSYPLLGLLAESMGHRFADVFERLELIEGTVAEYLTGAESMILPELAGRIQATFALGLKLCDEIQAAHEQSVALIKQQLGEAGEEVPVEIPMPAQIALVVDAYRGSAAIGIEMVSDVTAEEVDIEADEEPAASPAAASPAAAPPAVDEPAALEAIELDPDIQAVVDEALAGTAPTEEARNG